MIYCTSHKWWCSSPQPLTKNIKNPRGSDMMFIDIHMIPMFERWSPIKSACARWAGLWLPWWRLVAADAQRAGELLGLSKHRQFFWGRVFGANCQKNCNEMGISWDMMGYYLGMRSTNNTWMVKLDVFGGKLPAISGYPNIDPYWEEIQWWG